MGSAHSKRRPVSKCVHWRHAWIGTRQFGHCSSDAVAIGRTAPHAPHRETVCLASIPPPLGASVGGGGGGDGRFGSPPWFRYPCCRYFRSDMLVVPFGPLLYPMPVAGAPVAVRRVRTAGLVLGCGRSSVSFGRTAGSSYSSRSRRQATSCPACSPSVAWSASPT